MGPKCSVSLHPPQPCTALAQDPQTEVFVIHSEGAQAAVGPRAPPAAGCCTSSFQHRNDETDFRNPLFFTLARMFTLRACVSRSAPERFIKKFKFSLQSLNTQIFRERLYG